MAISAREQELIRAYREAEDEETRTAALGRLRKRYFYLVLGVVLGMAAPGSRLADAAVDSTFARLAREIGAIDGPITAWLERTARQELSALRTSANDTRKQRLERDLGAEHAVRPVIERPVPAVV